MSRLSVALPPPGPQRMLALITAASAVSSGIYLSTVVLYFTRIVRISPMRVGVGLSIAGAACVVGGVLVGKLSDRHDPLLVLRRSLIVAAVATLGFLAVDGFAMYLLVVPAAAAGQACVQLLTTAIITKIVTERANEFRAYTRSVLNVGIAVGIGLSALAVQFDSALLYRTAIVVGAIFLALAALLVGRLPALRPACAESPGGRSRWAALRDRPYLALTALDGVLSLQYRIQSVAIPLWIIGATTAPRWSIATLDMLNIAIVVLFQVRASRRVLDVPAAGAALRRCGWAFLVACVLFASARGHGGWIAVLILVAGGAILSVGELWQTAGGFEASNLLAPPREIGAYLGVFSIGLRMADTVGPALLAWLCVDVGVVGWYVTGFVLLAAGLLSPLVVAWAESTRDRYLVLAAR
ncbi:MFS transporter [Nocardia araoensis]|uniref:MFS transporter n=1 Tax=Nocardia araoensis TaxID=228600 RepID=UPI0002DA4A81|nr:MFS transporter [Nocardia araoensis]